MAVSRLMDVNYTIGALQVAVGISGFLLGCSTTQTYAYYKNYPYDPQATKIYVQSARLLETAQQVAAMHAVYAMSVTDWGHPSALLHPPTSISVTFHLGILIPPLLESFYLWRLHRLFGRALPCAAGAVFCWTRYAGWLLFVVQETQLGYVSGALLARWSWLLITVLAMGVVLNAGIAAAMVCYLRGQRDTVGMRTKVLVDRLLMWTLQTGVITAGLDGDTGYYHENLLELFTVLVRPFLFQCWILNSQLRSLGPSDMDMDMDMNIHNDVV
ncbi:hypothetical protein PC9H_009229 [Pleurotus ostreatus]|uniref:Uncharacterized protein n=1 Tax=Pleurotus ostreatus TaxID=5322 RepID=A0A8H6ZQ98_PLEOS|nr:uncharacterized protein PC9H_009229 [Pleurotus ostreatus]KAF7423931.1 hypothetical protein PC9H_009229 [Pleurotus ostreatus]